jgi:hypothetical protein
MAEDSFLIEMDPEKCRAIVASLRTYMYFCEQARNVPNLKHIQEIAYMRDQATKAMYQASQIGAEDDDPETS